MDEIPESETESWIGNCPKCHTPYRTNPPEIQTAPLRLPCSRPECGGQVVMTPIGGFPFEVDEISPECVGLPVIIDPDYSRFLVKARIIAKQEGYALAVHGSMIRDLDVVAVPWTAECRKPINLLTRICFNTGLKMQEQKPTVREHGRLVWSLLFPEFGDPRFVDFSVVPPNAEPIHGAKNSD